MGKSSIKKSLIEQLTQKGANIGHFSDLINDYMDFWEIKKSLISDIKLRGVVFNEVKISGLNVQKNNPSTKELVAINRQMLQILKELGLNTSCAVSPIEDEL